MKDLNLFLSFLILKPDKLVLKTFFTTKGTKDAKKFYKIKDRNYCLNFALDLFFVVNILAIFRGVPTWSAAGCSLRRD